jgi:hypothetical protein
MIEQNQFSMARKSYLPSGKVNFLSFIPLFIAAVLVACLMSIILCLIQDFAYYFIITPLLISLPILGLSYLMVRFGRCRLPVLAAAAGIVLMLLYYLGFWTLSYAAFVGYYGQNGREILKAQTGSSGLWGYFLLRCKTGVITSSPGNSEPRHNPTMADKYFHYGFYGTEFVILLFAGIAVPLNASRRVFYEGSKKWASAAQIHCRPGDFDLLMQIIDNNDLQKLSELSKLPKLSTGRSSMTLIFKVEFLKNSGDAPAYVTVKGTNLGKIASAKTAGAKGIFSISKTFVKQIEVPPADLAAIARALPELNITNDKNVISELARITSHIPQIQPIQLVSVPAPLKPTVQYDAGFKGWLQRTGLSSPRIVGPDFRLKAAQESRAIRAKHSMANLTDINSSFCLPVDDQYRCDPAGIAGLHKRLLFLSFIPAILGFLILFITAAVEPPGQKGTTPTEKILLFLAFGLMIGTLIILLFLSTIHKKILKHRLLTRPGSLFDPYAGGPFMFFHLEDSNTYHVRKSVPEDFCLCSVDTLRRRLFVEGCSYRYIVRSEDILRLEPIESGKKISIGLTWRIGIEQLAVVLSCESMYAHMVNPLLTRNNAGRMTNKIRTGLGLQSL